MSKLGSKTIVGWLPYKDISQFHYDLFLKDKSLWSKVYIDIICSSLYLESGFKENRARLRPKAGLRSGGFSLSFSEIGPQLSSDATSLGKLGFNSSEPPSKMDFACSRSLVGLLNAWQKIKKNELLWFLCN